MLTLHLHMRRLISVIAPCSLAACHVAQPAPPSFGGATSVLPGSRVLAPPSFVPETHRLLVSIRAPHDTAERTMATTIRTLAPDRQQRGQLLVTSLWEPPYTSVDTMIVEARGLVPVRERLDYNGFHRVYHYAGDRVWGTVQHGDSTPRPFERKFPERVFAFSEVDLLVRSLPFTVGASTVVPLFSESDEVVEHDTITIERLDASSAGEHAWIVRFADPAIVSTYRIGASSRAILSTETMQRRTGAILRYEQATR